MEKIEGMSSENEKLREEMESIRRNLSSMMIGHHAKQSHWEKIEKELDEAHQFVLQNS